MTYKVRGQELETCYNHFLHIFDHKLFDMASHTSIRYIISFSKDHISFIFYEKWVFWLGGSKLSNQSFISNLNLPEIWVCCEKYPFQVVTTVHKSKLIIISFCYKINPIGLYNSFYCYELPQVSEVIIFSPTSNYIRS